MVCGPVDRGVVWRYVVQLIVEWCGGTYVVQLFVEWCGGMWSS